MENHPISQSIELADNTNIVFISDSSELTKKLAFYTNKAEKIFLHSLIINEVVDYLADNKFLLNKCYWIIWGYALYYDLELKFYNRNDFNAHRHFKKIKQILKNVKATISCFPADYELAKNKFSMKGKYYRALNYDLLNIDENLNLKEKGQNCINIIVGHAADKNGRQLDVLQKLSFLNEENVQIYCPLTYGSDLMKEAIVSAGQKIFNDKFTPLLKHLPDEEYDLFLDQMDIGIYDLTRQRAGVNILKMISKGKKVYISDSITTYSSLKSYGFTIYPINQNQDYKNILNPFPKEIAVANHKIALKNFNKKAYLKKWEEIFYS